MHIALNGWFWDQPNVGSGQYLRQLVAALHKLNADVDLTLVMPPHNPQPDEVPAGVQVQPTGSGGTRNHRSKVWFEQRQFPRAARRSGAHLAHVPYWGSPLHVPVPMVVSVLDVIPLLYPIYVQGFFSRAYTALVQASARSADHVITISETSKLDIEQHLQIDSDDISVTYLAPDSAYHPRMGAEKDAAVREKYDLPERFVLGGFGFLPHKQIHELLLAFTYVAGAEGENAPLVLAGSEPDWSQPLYADLREYARRLDIEDYVHWIGYVDEADKPSLYRLADVFVFPSEYEGFGLPPLEAMACGTPVVAWDTVVADEVLEGGAYLVDSARSMGGAILALLLQDPLRETMTNQGLAQVTKYSWRKTAQETLRAYESVLRMLYEA